MQSKNRVVLITGGAKRLGNAITLALARRGYTTLFTYRYSDTAAQKTLDRLKTSGKSSNAYRVDLSKVSEVKRLMERIRKQHKRLDVLINVASNFNRTPLKRLTEKDWDAAMNTNAKGPFLCSLYASRLLMKQGGKIINFADWAAERPYTDYLPYCVSKAAVVTLTKSLAKELAPTIQVNAIAPGPILPPTGMTPSDKQKIARAVPLKRWGQPQDIVNAVLFLIEGTNFMTGSTLTVDGGRLIA